MCAILKCKICFLALLLSLTSLWNWNMELERDRTLGIMVVMAQKVIMTRNILKIKKEKMSCQETDHMTLNGCKQPLCTAVTDYGSEPLTPVK